MSSFTLVDLVAFCQPRNQIATANRSTAQFENRQPHTFIDMERELDIFWCRSHTAGQRTQTHKR